MSSTCVYSLHGLLQSCGLLETGLESQHLGRKCLFESLTQTKCLCKLRCLSYIYIFICQPESIQISQCINNQQKGAEEYLVGHSVYTPKVHDESSILPGKHKYVFKITVTPN